MIEGFYKKAKITIDEDLTIHPLENFDSLSQNSLGTQIISATLNGWELEDGAVIMFAFEKLSDGYNFTVGPILTAIDFALNTYWIKVPDEVMSISGEWRICVYKKFGFDLETGTADYSISGGALTFNIFNTVKNNNNRVNISIAEISNVIATYNSLDKEFKDRYKIFNEGLDEVNTKHDALKDEVEESVTTINFEIEGIKQNHEDLEQDFSDNITSINLEIENIKSQYTPLSVEEEHYQDTLTKINTVASNVATNYQTIADSTTQHNQLVGFVYDEVARESKALKDTLSTDIETVKLIAEGRGNANAHTFENAADMISALGSATNLDRYDEGIILGPDGTVYRIGDNLLIKAPDTPDYWISAIHKVANGVSVDEEGFTASGGRVYGFIEINYLESQKVNFSDYYTKDEADAAFNKKPFIITSATTNAEFSKIVEEFEKGNTNVIYRRGAEYFPLLAKGASYLYFGRHQSSEDGTGWFVGYKINRGDVTVSITSDNARPYVPGDGIEFDLTTNANGIQIKAKRYVITANTTNETFNTILAEAKAGNTNILLYRDLMYYSLSLVQPNALTFEKHYYNNGQFTFTYYHVTVGTNGIIQITEQAEQVATTEKVTEMINTQIGLALQGDY